MVVDKENVSSNRGGLTSTVVTKEDVHRPTSFTAKASIYNDEIVDLLMVSPPPSSLNRQLGHRTTRATPTPTNLTPSGVSSMSPIPPPGSELVRSAIRDAGRALDAEMKDVYDSFFVDSLMEDSIDLSSSSTLFSIDVTSSMTPMRYSVGSTPTKPGRTLFSILGSLEEDEDESFAQIEEIEESALQKEDENEEEEEIIENFISPIALRDRDDDSTTTSEDDGEIVDGNDEQSIGIDLSKLALIDYNDINAVDDGSIGSVTSDASSCGIVDCDDESVTCFDRCGIWDLDSGHKGDLLLSSDKETKWPKVRLPLIVYEKLFNHQRIGVQWMASLHDSIIGGGILADDMGLGKTMQTLAFLGSLMRAKTISNAIVVCPKSVVRSWEREANLILKNMCVPKATVYAVTSDMIKKKRLQIFSDSYCTSVNAPRLVITTYGLVSNHITDLNSIANANSEHHWWYVILDEGHQIKNSNTKTSQDVRILSRNEKTRRLLLTGTPIQNNMRELHAIFDWATSSKLLGSIKSFMNRYGHIIEEGRQRNASEWTVKKSIEMNTELQRKLQPYFLQRLKKTEFEGTMPGKKELVVFTRLSAKQRRMYSDYTEGIIFDSELSPLAAVSWLKMLCGHPSLVKEASRKYINCDSDLLLKDCAKLKVLIDLLIRLKHSGHRTLVFSQSTKMLDVIEKVFTQSSVSYLRIDGSTAGNLRQKAVDDFNDCDNRIDAMLLSTKAAGVGLTLTGADRAIIFDPSWNPSEDSQAVDRCYRIGQTKDVTVYRFIAAGTVEEKMYEKQVHKDGIKRVILSSDSATARYFDNSELKDLFKLGEEGVSDTLEKFSKKSDNSAAGATGMPSFLSKHPLVVGVASHDVLYSSVEVANDEVQILSSDEAPFSRKPFQRNDSQLIHQLQDLNVDDTLTPLGGQKNKTRQIIDNAKARRTQESSRIQVCSTVEQMLTKADSLIAIQEYGKAMVILLDLVDKETKLSSDTQLSLHMKVSCVASLLGWL